MYKVICKNNFLTCITALRDTRHEVLTGSVTFPDRLIEQT